MDDLKQFIEERNEALLSLDKSKIERFAKKYDIHLPTDDEVFWRGVHKAICNISSIPFEARQKSADYLFKHRSTPLIGGADNG